MSAPDNVNAWLAIAAAGIPEVANLIKAILSLRKKYPSLTPEQINALVADVTTQSDALFDQVISKIDADQKSE